MIEPIEPTFIYTVHLLHDMIEGDECPSYFTTYDLKTAQDFALNHELALRVYAHRSAPLDPYRALEATHATSEPRLYTAEEVGSLAPCFPFSGDLPTTYEGVNADLLPIFGFVGDRAVHIRKDRTGYTR